MNLLLRLKVRTRLTAGFLCVFCLVGAASGVGIWKLAQLGKVVHELVTDHAEKRAMAQRWQLHIATNLVRTRTSLVIYDPALNQNLAREMKATSATISSIQEQIEKSVTDPVEIEALAKIGGLRARYREARDQLTKRREGGDDVSEDVSQVLEPMAAAYLAAIDGFVARQEQQLEEARRDADSDVRRARVLMIALVLLGLGAAIGLAVVITRSIVTPIRSAQQGAARIAAGDLTVPLQADGRDEIAELVHAISQMQESLRVIAAKVRESSDAVASAATQIAAGNTDLSSRTEEQASSLQETAASIEQMTATVNQTAQNATQADGLASTAAEVARRGGEAVDEVVRMMENIQSASRKISEIIGVIDSIAFQTNILALNAAVEAARAGEQGRGFAVVAGEVRNLAQRSADAAREIKGLITSSVEQVDAGARLAGDAGQTMTEVVASVNRVSKIIGEIAGAATEQSTGIGQVNQAVSDLDKVTQQNASLVEESTAAAESLRTLSVELVDAVAVFRLAAAGAGRDSPALPAPMPRRPIAAPVAVAKPRLHAPAAQKAGDEWREF